MNGYEPLAIKVGDRYVHAYRRWFMDGHIQAGQTRLINLFSCKSEEQAIKLATRHIRNRMDKPVFFRKRKTALQSISDRHRSLIYSKAAI